MWSRGEGVGGLFNAKGEKISKVAPRVCNMGCWWDVPALAPDADAVDRVLSL